MKWAALLFVISILTSVILLNPHVRAQTREYFFNKNKTILSQLEFESSKKNYKIIKAQTPMGLSVELYRIHNNEILLLDRQHLTDKKDAHYKFGQNKYNLFLKDINQDGNDEIILPTLDKNLKARLNIFVFDPEQEKLLKISQH